MELRGFLPDAGGVWQDVVNEHFPGSAWLRCGRETLDALSVFKAEHALPTWDATLSALLAAAGPRRTDRGDGPRDRSRPGRTTWRAETS